MAYFELDEKTQALTYPPNPLLGGTVTILVNTTVKGSPAERYILQHELHHAGSDPSLGQMEREYAGHLSAIRSFVEEHPEFLKGFDALKIANKDRYVAQLYFQARIWADRLTDGTFPSMSPLIRECDKLKEREVLPDKSPLCEKVRSAILGDSERGHSPCRLSEPCGGYPGLFYIINRNYEGSGESLRMDQPSQAWLKEEIKGDLEFRSRHRYDMKTKR